MKRKIVGICVFMLMIATTMPSFGKMIEPKSIRVDTFDDTQEIYNQKSFKQSEQFVLLHQTVTIRHHLFKRNYLLYMPTNYDDTSPVPLVVVFHGGGNTPENASGRFGVSEKAEEEGFIVVYPNASEIMGDQWHFGLGWFTENLIDEFGRLWFDEVGYTKKIIVKTQRDYNIDPNRIYLAGHSSGAMMAYYCGSRLSNIIAALASNAGCIGAHIDDFKMVTIPEPKNPVSIAIFHSEQDTVCPYNGGKSLWYDLYVKSVQDAVDFWVENNGCNPEPETNITVNGNVTIDLYSGGDAGTEIIVYSLKNKGHIWFGGLPWEDPDPYISTTDEMWEFFEAHPKQ